MKTWWRQTICHSPLGILKEKKLRENKKGKMAAEKKEDERLHRPSLKSHVDFNNYAVWKDKLREKCIKRVREDRTRLLWKLRLSNDIDQSTDQQDIVKATLKDIVADELKSIKDSSVDACFGHSSIVPATDDAIWEYDGPPVDYEGDREEILLEMQRIFYEDLKYETSIEDSKIGNWDDEEDEYLAREVYQHMQLQDEQGQKKIWCPVCKHGALRQQTHFISCTLCKLKLDVHDEVNLELLCARLAEVHTEHLDRGCTLKPGFCMESRFGLTALFIKCGGCGTFEVVI